MPNPEISQGKRDEMVAAYASGISSRKVASLFGVDKSTVIGEVKRRGEIAVPVGYTSPIPQHERDAMVEAYCAGASCETAAGTFGYSGKACLNALKDAGVPVRRLCRKATQEEKDAMVAAYVSGESSATIAARFGFSNQPLYRELKRLGIPRREISDRPYKRALSPNQVEEAIRRNARGEDVTSIGRSFGVHGNTVAGEIRRTGIEIVLTKTMLSKEQQSEVVRRYQAGEGSTLLSRVFGIRPDAIRDLLERRGIERPGDSRKWLNKLTEGQKTEVVELYLRGKSTSFIADKVGIASGSVGCLLKRRGIKMRQSGDYTPAVRRFSPEQQEWVCEMYQSGKGIKWIVKKMPASFDVVKRCLEENGVGLRGVGTEGLRKQMSARNQGIDLREWDSFTSSWRQQVCQTSEYKKWKISVLTRDAFTCQICGTKKGPFDGHHIHRVATTIERAYDVANGITLCKPCHHKIAAKEEEFAPQFEALIEGKAIPEINLGPVLEPKEVVEMYLRGATIKSIQEKHKTSFQRVVGILTRAGAYRGRSKRLSRNLLK